MGIFPGGITAVQAVGTAKDNETLPQSSMDQSFETGYADSAMGYAASKQLFLSFYSFNAKKTVNFHGFIMSLSDSYSSDWNEEKMFGRNDPVYTFKSTTRTISVAFQVVASTLWEAMSNLENVGYLTKFAYPAYTYPFQNSTSMTSPPLVQLKLGNFIADQNQFKHQINKGNVASAKNGGLLGVIRSLTITPQFDSGVFDEYQATIYPKLIEVSFDFGVLHQHKIGYSANKPGTWIGPQQFPYGVGGDQNVTTAQSQARTWAVGGNLPSLSYNTPAPTKENLSAEASPGPSQTSEGLAQTQAEEAGVGSTTQSMLGGVKQGVRTMVDSMKDNVSSRRAERMQGAIDEATARLDKFAADLSARERGGDGG
jgi:hypothetical protein